MDVSIRRFAIGLGHEEKYHATITKAWVGPYTSRTAPHR